MGIGWAYIDCDPEIVTGAFGPTGSVMFKDGHRSIRGDAALMFIRPGIVAEGFTPATGSAYTTTLDVGDTFHPPFLQVSGNLRVSGTVFANTFDVMTTTLTEIHQSGSTSFGQVFNRDKHSFSGSIQAEGAGTLNAINSYVLDRFGIGEKEPKSTPHSTGTSNDAKAEISVADGEALTALVIDANDVDEVAMHIEAAQTTANVLEITADAVTTANVIDVSADALTQGSAMKIEDGSASTVTRDSVLIRQSNASATTATALKVVSLGNIGIDVDKDFQGTGASTLTGLNVDFDKTQATTTSNTMFGINVDMDNTTATNGNNTMTGIQVTPTLTHNANAGTPIVKGAVITATGGSNGTSTTTGMELTATGADTNNGLIINCADGGTDFKIVSSADTDDHFKIQVAADGATTITTFDDGGHAADLTMNIDGFVKIDGDGVEIENDNDSGATALLIDNDDTDEIALSIAAENIDANVVDIAADAVTTARALNISADALSTGTAFYVESESTNNSTRNVAAVVQNAGAAINATALLVQSDSNGGVAGIKIDRNANGTAAVDAVTGLQIDLDQTGEITSATGVVVGIQTDVETNVAGDGTVNSFGHRIVMTGDTDGTHTNTGLSINVGQAGTNTHIEMLSSANTSDKCTISVGEDGETTITTIEDGGGSTGHLNFVVDGNVFIKPAGLNVQMIDDGNSPVFQFDLTDPTFKITDDADVNDFFTINVSTNGLTTLATTDSGGSNANLVFSPNGVSVFTTTARPDSDNAVDLGASTVRWANVYTVVSHVGDLHLENDRGNWLIVEEEDYLSIRNQKTGQLYKFVLEEIEE